MKIVTSHVRPPIPTRDHDWIAHDDNWEPGQPIGEGATEVEAIADLREQLDDIDEARALEAKEDAKRERDSYTTGNGSIEWA